VPIKTGCPVYRIDPDGGGVGGCAGRHRADGIRPSVQEAAVEASDVMLTGKIGAAAQDDRYVSKLRYHSDGLAVILPLPPGNSKRRSAP
jgi:hypothetical protein